MPVRFVRTAVPTLFLALAAVFTATPGSWEHFKFKIGNFDRDGETRSIEDSIRLFNSTISGLYASGGNLAGLNMFPADNMVKRMFIVDLKVDKDEGRVLVMDRDRSTLKEVFFSDPARATAVYDESWFMQYQNAETRRPISGKKANLITVRYYLHKKWSRWIVMHYEVFGRTDVIPPARRERFTAW